MKVIKKILLGCACLSVLGTTACNNSDKPISQEEMSQEEMFQEFHTIIDLAKKQDQWSISGMLRNGGFNTKGSYDYRLKWYLL